jgi:hypothetical protein
MQIHVGASLSQRQPLFDSGFHVTVAWHLLQTIFLILQGTLVLTMCMKRHVVGVLLTPCHHQHPSLRVGQSVCHLCQSFVRLLSIGSSHHRQPEL